MTLGRLFELYVDVFEKFGSHLLNEPDQMIDYYVFEATDINVGYCSKRILAIFLDEGIIDKDIFENSLLLLKNFRALENKLEIRDASSIRNSPEWRYLMELADKIKEMIKGKWSDCELKAIFDFDQPVSINGE